LSRRQEALRLFLRARWSNICLVGVSEHSSELQPVFLGPLERFAVGHLLAIPGVEMSEAYPDFLLVRVHATLPSSGGSIVFRPEDVFGENGKGLTPSLERAAEL
jgi:hypothetical protein